METLKIDINDGRKIFAIQEEFNEVYPNLKLTFYGKPHTDDGPHSEKLITNPNTTLAESRNAHNDGTITILPDMTIVNLEDNFRDVYGLKVEILVKAGDEWIASDAKKLSLKEQNQGE